MASWVEVGQLKGHGNKVRTTSWARVSRKLALMTTMELLDSSSRKAAPQLFASPYTGGQVLPFFLLATMPLAWLCVERAPRMRQICPLRLAWADQRYWHSTQSNLLSSLTPAQCTTLRTWSCPS